MTNRISEIKAKIGSGARPNKFMVYITFPQNLDVGSTNLENDAAILCKASSIPDKTIGVIEVWNQGRKLVLPGDTSYPNQWTLTFYNTEEHNLRRAMLEWMRSIDHFQDNMHSGVPIEVMADLSVSQLDSAMNETVRYTFHCCWPQDIQEISVGDDQQDSVTQTQVTFAYTHWVVGDGNLDKPLQYNSATKNFIA